MIRTNSQVLIWIPSNVSPSRQSAQLCWMRACKSSAKTSTSNLGWSMKTAISLCGPSLFMLATLDPAPTSLLNSYRPLLILIRSPEHLNPLKRLVRVSKQRVCEHRSIAYHSTTSEPYLQPDQELFTYTSVRYLYHTKLQRAKKDVPLNITALKDIAVNCVNRRTIKRTENLSQGGFNKVFLHTLNDAFKVLAKLPYPLTVPKRLSTYRNWSYHAGLSVFQRHSRSSIESMPGFQKVTTRLDQKTSSWYRLRDSHWNHGILVRHTKNRARLVNSFDEIEGKMFYFALRVYGSL